MRWGSEVDEWIAVGRNSAESLPNALHDARILPESETDEKTRGDVRHKFGDGVVDGIAPDGNRAASRHDEGLMDPRG